MRILFLSRWYPYPTSNGSKLRIFHLLAGLAQQHQVALISFFEEADAPLDPGPLDQLCAEIQVVPWRGFNPQSGLARFGYMNTTPRYYLDTFSAEMQECIQQTLAHNAYDLVIASQIDMAAYGPFLGSVPAIFEEAEVGTLYEQHANASTLQQRVRYGLTWRKHRRYLQSLLAHFGACTVVSAAERELLERALGSEQGQAASGVQKGAAEIAVIPNGVDVASYAPARGRTAPKVDSLIFTGSFNYAPNYEAMCWFVAKVLPLVHTIRPDVQLTITGKQGNCRLPHAPGVQLTGFVEDVRPLVAASWISLAPLHTGGGTRLKILEAMALGTPVVATSKGAEGLAVQPGKHLLVADTPADFAQAVLQLLQNEPLRQELAHNALLLVTEKYDWGVIAPQFLALVEKVAYRE